jgi:dTDP-glucose 4,6-dehydratase
MQYFKKQNLNFAGGETMDRKDHGIDVRRIIQAGWDGLSWVVAVPVAVLLRFDNNPGSEMLNTALLVGMGLGVFQVLLGYLIQEVRGRDIIGSFDEVFTVVSSSAAVALLGTIFIFLDSPASFLPRSVPLIAWALVISLLLGGRFTLRAYRQRSLFSKNGERVLIYGAGDSGEQIVRQMLLDSNAQFTPVGFLDDNSRKRRLRIQGIRVLGNLQSFEKVVRGTRADTVVVAIAGVSAKQLLELDNRASALGISLRVIPTTSEIVGGAVKLGDITHVTEEDLLGRRPIETDEMAISEFLAGKRILITGAGGSIGSELARQIHRYHPAFVGILDRDESAIHAVQLSIDGQGLLSSDNLILADIRDRERMTEVMQIVKPDIVFHAAALKHLPLLERYPEEGHKTNVLGTQNVLHACAAVGVYAFINISTDKAADPVNVLGRTKLMTERLTAGVETYPTPLGPSRYLSVRFGNVLGSRGSVLTAFRYQIEKGGPVTVTDPNVTRYFMTISEAVHLVLQAAVIGDHGETLILDMGEPIKIAEVARKMVEKSGREINIVITGLRQGEKLNETLIGIDETSNHRQHPLIIHTRVSPANTTAL